MSNVNSFDPLRLQADLSAIVREVERLTGRASRWSRSVVVGTERDRTGAALYFGAKHWNCDITIHQDRLTHPGLYSSLVHEAFHSVSAGLNEPDYQTMRGFEEGVVEACTRLFRNAILTAANLPPAPDVRASYNRYLVALENLRIQTGMVEADFFLTLLSLPLPDREATVLQWIQNAKPATGFLQMLQDTDVSRRELKR